MGVDAVVGMAVYTEILAVSNTMRNENPRQTAAGHRDTQTSLSYAETTNLEKETKGCLRNGDDPGERNSTGEEVG